MGIVVSGLALTPVKGTRLRTVDRIELQPGGARDDRRFFVIDERDRMVNAKQLGAMNAVVADYSGVDRRLTLTFPDGRVVEDEVQPAGPVSTWFYSRTNPATLVRGPWSAALSEYIGQPLRLVEKADGIGAVDRGADGAASLVSRASLARLARAAGTETVDGRRFRMLIEIDGVEPHEEDQWVRATVRVGGAVIQVRGHVGRCLITSRHPDTGQIDLPTLDFLRDYRAHARTTEPLPFGIYGEVVRAGEVHIGDEVAVDG